MWAVINYILAIITGVAVGVYTFYKMGGYDSSDDSHILVVGKRQSGRSTKLIREAAKYNYALIVCSNKREAGNTYRMAREMGYNIPYPITFNDFVKKNYYGRNVQVLLFDNLDKSIKEYTDVPIVKIVVEDK